MPLDLEEPPSSVRYISFFVVGTPSPGGSKRFVGFGKRTGRAILIDAAGERNRNWKAAVAAEAHNAKVAQKWITSPPGVALSCEMVFLMPRPKGHYRTGKNAGLLREGAPTSPTTMPDTLKLARSTEDACTGIVWADDAQTVHLTLIKRYAMAHESPGCEILCPALP